MNAPDLAHQLISWFHDTAAKQFVIALSGGVDSAVVAQAAVLSGRPSVAVTAHSPSLAVLELQDASHIAAAIGIEHRVLETNEISNPDYRKNDARRCYHCKSQLFAVAGQAFSGGLIVTGTNRDDLADYRPGLMAAQEHRVRAPLAELGIGKSQVRELARHWKLNVAEKPASPCLASRLAYGVAVTAERLERIEQAEQLLRQLGLHECRVRLHEGELARIEVSAAEIERLARLDVRRQLSDAMRKLGFRFVTLDLEGFRSGSLNQLVELTAP